MTTIRPRTVQIKKKKCSKKIKKLKKKKKKDQGQKRWIGSIRHVLVVRPQETTEKDGWMNRETEDYPQLDHRKSYLALQ